MLSVDTIYRIIQLRRCKQYTSQTIDSDVCTQSIALVHQCEGFGEFPTEAKVTFLCIVMISYDSYVMMDMVPYAMLCYAMLCYV